MATVSIPSPLERVVTDRGLASNTWFKFWNALAGGVSGGSSGIPDFSGAIDGGFLIANAATSAALTTAVTYPTFDVWWAIQPTAAAGTIAQVASTNAGSRFDMKLQRTAASVVTNTITAGQSFETADSVKYAGKTCVLTFTAKAGADFSGATLTSTIDTGTGTDQSAANQVAGSWTGQASASQSNATSPGYVTYSQVVAVPSGTKQVGIRFSWTPIGVAGADDSVSITNVDFRAGSSAATYTQLPAEVEIARANRLVLYFADRTVRGGIRVNGYAAGAGVFIINSTLFPTEMRAVPTATVLGVWTNVNCGGPAFAPSKTGVESVTQSVAAGQVDTSAIGAGVGVVFSARL